jgi:IS5 family transposase
MGTQLGFAEALVNPKAGRNRRLDAIDAQVDWASVEPLLPRSKPSTSPGRPGYRALTMFKALLLAQWYQLSDPGLEEALSDRLSFRRFCGFALDDITPDETTLCRFRNDLADSGAGEKLMAELCRQLDGRGLIVKQGTMIDATMIEAQAARPKDSKPPTEAAATPQSGAPARPPFDPDAGFARKGGKSFYGYKAHVAVDCGSGLIRRACLTPANVHDSVPADGLVMGDEKAVYADKAYSKHARRIELKTRGINDRIMHRANKHQPELPHWQKVRNRLISGIRAQVERTFGIWRRAYGYARVRYFRLAANAFELQLKCIAFNLRRMVVLTAT